MKHTFSACCCAILISISAQAQKGASHFEIDTRAPLQTIDGFGASDAWSMQHIGLWPDSVRLQTADWLFSTENDSKGQPLGIGLSIWRFNIGAGSHDQGRESGIGSHWMRTGCFLRPDGTYDWTQQPGQRNFLRMAQERGVRTFIGFFNSPPVYFTQNGLATNTGRGGTLNLKTEHYGDFALFAANVVEGLEQHDGIKLSYVCPVNEPDGHWNWVGPKQEGTPDVTNHISTPFHFITTGATTFAAGINLQDFSASYESVFRPAKSEDIAFRFQTQGITKLSIDGKEVAAGMNFKNKSKVYTLQAEAGKEYRIKIDFAFRNRDAALDFDMGREVPVDLKQTVDKVKEADVIIFAGGISPAVEGEEMHVNIPGFKGGDRETIELPSIQSRLLAELKKAGKKIVFVNFSGSAIALTPESKTCDAILQAWYPGQAGGTAIANVLFGDYNPAGRLPVTFYKSTKQLPDFEDYSMKGRTYRYMTENPLFPFGHGLSYTTFQYGNASLNTSEIKDGEQVTLTIPVSNTGKYDGEEVVQVYLRHPGDKEGPSHALRAFKRVAIAKGATNNVTIPLSKENFEWFDTSTNTMRPIEGDYEILYGGTSELKQLKSIPITIK